MNSYPSFLQLTLRKRKIAKKIFILKLLLKTDPSQLLFEIASETIINARRFYCSFSGIEAQVRQKKSGQQRVGPT